MGPIVSTRLARAALVSLAALIVGVGCGAHDGSEPPQNDLGLGDLEVLPQGRLWEPAQSGDLDYRVVPPSRESKQLEQTLGSGGGKRVVYINAHGGTYTPGWDDSGANRSSIIDGTVKIAAYREGAQAWTELKTCLVKEYARWNVTVTDVDPGQAPHVEAVIGGMPGAVGLPQSVGGVAPMANDGSVIDRAVVYVFSENLRNAQYECEVAAHEVGHAFGLEHEYLCADPMTYLEGCGHKTFQDKAAYCGTDSAVTCRNGGKQNTVLHLNEVLGLSKPGAEEDPPAPPKPPVSGSDDDDDGESAPPTVSLLSPKNGATFEPKTLVSIKASVKGDAKLKKVVLRWEKDGETTLIDCAAPVSGTDCSRSGSSYTWTVRAGAGERTWSIVATDVEGHRTTSEKRTISLEEQSAPVPPKKPEPEPEPEPDPQGVPGGDEATVVTPAEGAIVHRGEKLPVVIDDAGYAAVWIVWSGPGGAQIYPLKRDDDDGRWKADLQIAAGAATGARAIQVMAIDAEGATIKGATRKVRVK